MSESWAVRPGHDLTLSINDTTHTIIALGAALQHILSSIEKEKDVFPAIDIHFSQSDPLAAPVIVSLPSNGLRLRFDGADQRLRLIEVTDFTKIALSYDGHELAKESDGSLAPPMFKRVYRILSPSFPGEYLPPAPGKSVGTYILSWPGIAWNFPVQHSAWAPEKDHVSLLGSHATSPATHMAIFEGKTWADARKDLFLGTPSGARSTAFASRPFDKLAPEVEVAHVLPGGVIELERRQPAPSFKIQLGKTTPQDLITELGAPDATFKPSAAKSDTSSRNRNSNGVRRGSEVHHKVASPPSSYSSTNTDTFETEFEEAHAEEDVHDRRSRDIYWCYFCHGLDILIGEAHDTSGAASTETDLVVRRVVVQGNIPGSAAFNRHRRLRWTLELPRSPQSLDSESHFERQLKPALLATFTEAAKDPQTAMGRVINRCWDDSTSESSFFLPDQDRSLGDEEDRGQDGKWLGNVRLFHFPGLMFEVVKNGAVASLYVSG